MDYAARKMIELHRAGKISNKVAEDVLLTELKTVEHRVSEYRKDWNDLAHTINRMGRKYPAAWKKSHRPDLREEAGKTIHERTFGEAGFQSFLEEITWERESDEFIDKAIRRLEWLKKSER